MRFSSVLVVVLVCCVVVSQGRIMAEGSGKKEVKLETEERNDPGVFKVELHGHQGNLAAWDKIMKKDMARAQWIASRIAAANENKAKEDNKE